MPRRYSFTDADKGTPVCIIAGKYKGRVGYVHTGLNETDEMIYVVLAQSGRHDEEVKHVYKTSIQYGGEDEPKIWEEAMLRNKKIQPHYEKFLTKLLETEIEPTPEAMAVIWIHWKQKYARRQEQTRSKGIIRVSSSLQHPTLRTSQRTPGTRQWFWDKFKATLQLYYEQDSDAPVSV
jgi:hypothetical protein